MRYLTLDEAMKIAEDVTGIDADTLARVSRLELLDSALHAPSSGFGDVEFYPDFFDKAAVLGVRNGPDVGPRRDHCVLRLLPRG